MQKIYFRFAGKFHPEDTVHLTSRHRVGATSTIFHLNRYTTELRAPANWLKNNFGYDRKSQVYAPKSTPLKWREVAQCVRVYDHEKQCYIPSISQFLPVREVHHANP